MAIKSLDSIDQSRCKINVTLRNGEEYLGCDCHDSIFSATENLLYFWDKNALMIIPVDLVAKIAIYSE